MLVVVIVAVDIDPFQSVDEYHASMVSSLNVTEFTPYHGYAYDGIWTLAQATENVLKVLPNLHEYDYK